MVQKLYALRHRHRSPDASIGDYRRVVNEKSLQRADMAGSDEALASLFGYVDHCECRFQVQKLDCLSAWEVRVVYLSEEAGNISSCLWTRHHADAMVSGV